MHITVFIIISVIVFVIIVVIVFVAIIVIIFAIFHSDSSGFFLFSKQAISPFKCYFLILSKLLKNINIMDEITLRREKMYLLD